MQMLEKMLKKEKIYGIVREWQTFRTIDVDIPGVNIGTEPVGFLYRQISWGNLNIANQLLKVLLDYNPARDVPPEKPVPPSFSSN